MNTLTNPIVSAVMVILALACLVLAYRSVRAMWASHGTAATLCKRQAAEAEKAVLYYRALAEQYDAAADGYERTLRRLERPPLDQVLKDMLAQAGQVWPMAPNEADV